MPSFSQDLSNSAHDFLRVVWPAVSPHIGGGRIVPVEGKTDSELASLIDMNSGIDAWQFAQGGQMRGIASRVQWGKSWQTFTVRYKRSSGSKTEFAKRVEAIYSDCGWLYPHYTVQAFLSGPPKQGDLIEVAVVKTADLIEACQLVLAQPMQMRWAGGIRNTSNAQFIYINWRYFTRQNKEICLISSQTTQPQHQQTSLFQL